jgi:hypothetical protein
MMKKARSAFEPVSGVNPERLSTVIKLWTRMNEMELIQHFSLFSYCDVHKKLCISPAAYYNLSEDALHSECSMCLRGENWFDEVSKSWEEALDDSVLKLAEEAEKTWKHVNESAKNMKGFDEDDDEVAVAALQIDMKTRRQMELTKLQAWICYTFAAWRMSLLRRKGNDSTTIREYISRFVRIANERNVPGTPSLVKLRCFVHNKLGDLMMHRRSGSYKSCNICTVPSGSQTQAQRPASPVRVTELANPAPAPAGSSTDAAREEEEAEAEEEEKDRIKVEKSSLKRKSDEMADKPARFNDKFEEKLKQQYQEEE